MKLLKRTTELLAAGILLAIVLVIFAQVVGRYFLSVSLSWPEELSRYLLVWLVFIGGAAAVASGDQLVVDTLTELSPRRFRRAVRFIAPIGGLAGVLVLAQSSVPLFGPASRTVSPATDIPLGWVYAALPVGCVLAAIFLCHSLYMAIFHPEAIDIDPVEQIIQENTGA